MKAHLYGTAPYLPDAAFIDADELARQSGGNTGNLMFCHALSRIFEAGATSLPWGADLSHLSADSDRLLLPLANQLGPHVDLAQLAERFSKVTIPMVGVGLGAQGPIGGIDPDAIPEGSWQWLRTLVERAPSDKPNVALRGEATLGAIRSRGLADHCIVTGCPSNFINPSSSLGREIYRRRANGLHRVAVAAGNPFLPQFRRLEQSLVDLVESSEGIYVCQHPIDMIRLARGDVAKISRVNWLRYRDYIHPTLSDDDFGLWFRRYAHSFVSVPEWMATMRRFDVVVGTRIHGVMAGLQAGVPSLCLCIDSRTLELCRTMGVPHLDANDCRDGITRDRIGTALREWEWRRYDDTRRQLAARLNTFAGWNGLVAQGGVTEILKGGSRSFQAYTDKPANASVHQVSTASFDDRYRGIFQALDRTLGLPTPKILSFGCSDGFEPNDLASKHFHHGNIIGCDVDVDALRIARMHNLFPSRVEIIESTPARLQERAPFDAIVAMAVLCRWPDTRELDDIGGLYPFEKFAESIAELVSLLRPGGVLCVYNANYSVLDTASASGLEVVALPELLPRTQPVKLFDNSGRTAPKQEVAGILFRKRESVPSGARF
jgi:SAM-dependent methyltransferase